MWATKTAAVGFAVVSCVPVIATLWEQTRPIVKDVEIKAVSLDNNTYQVSLFGNMRQGCEVKGGSATMVIPPRGGRDLGQWAFDIEPGASEVSLEIRLSCRKVQEHQQTLGPYEIVGP